MHTRTVMRRGAWRAAWPLGLLLGLLWLGTPAAAYGCGAVFPRDGDATMTQERALIQWDGRTQHLVMELGLQGRSDDAAWIVPVPTPATVQLGDPDLFATLQALTKPQITYDWQFLGGLGAPGGGGGGLGGPQGAAPPPVTVLDRQTLGPLDVSTLAATDATALRDWLATNGYPFPPELGRVLQQYVDNGWFYVAVKLVPGAAGQALTGTLDPLWLTFATPEMVYPIRSSSLARDGFRVVLYVVADHRVLNPVMESVQNSSEVTYAQWIDPATLEADAPLRPFVPHRQFVTKIDAWFGAPGAIRRDFTFAYAARDDTYRATETRTTDVGALLCLAVLGVSIVGFIIWERRTLH